MVVFTQCDVPSGAMKRWRERERKRKNRGQERGWEQDWQSKCEQWWEFQFTKELVLVCFPHSPLQVIEGILVLRSECLWDSVPGQGQGREGLCKEWVLIPQLWPLWSRRECSTWEVWILEHVAWRGKGRRGSVKTEQWWNQAQRQQKRPGLGKSDPDTWQERPCRVPGNCRWAVYILPPALRSPFLSNSSLHFDVLGFCLHLSLPLQIL